MRQISNKGIFWSLFNEKLCQVSTPCMQATPSSRKAQKKNKKAPFHEKVSFSQT